MESLPADMRSLIDDAQKSRAVSVLVSDRLEVPTAIGFRKPAVILPAWMLENTPAEELKYILLHELAHLSRRDDWTNLAQKILKALLFFLPSVWWIERRLSLDREMACDDAVLVHSGTPAGYAECLAHVAERSFLRKQIALAQAAVGRVRQLTARVTRILDPERPKSTQMWKPAVPVVMVVALLCAVPASFTPELVGFADEAPATKTQASSQQKINLAPGPAANKSGGGAEVHMVPASLKIDSDVIAPTKAKATLAPKNNVGHARRTPSEESSTAGDDGKKPITRAGAIRNGPRRDVFRSHGAHTFRRAAELAGTHVAGELAAAIQGRTKTPKDLEEFLSRQRRQVELWILKTK